MGTFDFNAPAELFAGTLGVRRQGSLRYLRFDSAAEAIRHTMEQLLPAERGRTVLEVGDDRYEGAVIQKLYASSAYPLTRQRPSA